MLKEVVKEWLEIFESSKKMRSDSTSGRASLTKHKHQQILRQHMLDVILETFTIMAGMFPSNKLLQETKRDNTKLRGLTCATRLVELLKI